MKELNIIQYIKLKDKSEYDFVLEHLRPKNSFCGSEMNINQMSYINVRYCLRLIPKCDNWEVVQELFELCFSVSKDDFYNAAIDEFFSAKNYLIEQFEKIAKREYNFLKSIEKDAELWKLAGGDRLKPYSDTLPLAELGKAFGIWPYDIGRKPYGEVATMIRQLGTYDQVQNEFLRLKNE